MKLLLGAVCGLFCLVGSSRAQSVGKTSSSILDSNSRAVVTDSASDLIRNYYRFTIGGGLGSFGYDGGFAFGIYGSFQRSHSIFSVGVTSASSQQLTGVSRIPSIQSATEYDVLYGYGYVRGTLFYSASAGLSYTRFDHQGAHLRDSAAGSANFPYTIQIYQELKTASWGLPVQLQLMLDFSPVIGVGIIYYANFSSPQISNGFLMCLQVGWF